MLDAHLGPLNFPTVFEDLKEVAGGALEAVGATLTAAEERPKPFELKLPVHGEASAADFYEYGAALRRALRAVLANRRMRMRGLYFAFDADPELNGWLMVGGGEIAYVNGGATLNEYEAQLTDCFKVASLRTHRPAIRVESFDRRLSTRERDYLGEVYSTDFATMTTQALNFLPVGVSDVLGTGRTLLTLRQRASKDGQMSFVVDRPHAEVVNYQTAEVALIADGGAVKVWDRRGAGTNEALWERVYGPDHPLTANDVPVLENGVCRVRYAPPGGGVTVPGLAVDVWTGAAWSEQGKLLLYRTADTNGFVDTLVGAHVAEYTPERAVLELAMRSSADINSRERIFLTLQRGWTGPRVEAYFSKQANGGSPGQNFWWYAATTASSASAYKIDAAAVGAINTTVPGSGLLNWANVGASTFTGENHATMAQEGGAYAVTMAAVQSGVQAISDNGSTGYGTARNVLGFTLTGTYLSAQLGFHALQAATRQEAEGIRHVSGTTTQIIEGTAFGGNIVQESQVAATNPTLRVPTVSSPTKGLYQVFARVRVVDAGATGSIYAQASGGTTPTRTFTSTSYIWVNLGPVTHDAAAAFLEVRMWRSAGTGNTRIDRIELVKLEDRTASAPTYDGARDLGAQALRDVRSVPTLVER